MTLQRLITLLKLDAGANVAVGVVLLSAAGWLAGPVGLERPWSLRAVGLALVIYGIGNLLVARRTTVRGLTVLVVGDLVFAAAVLSVALLDPTSAEAWVRWVLVAVADVAAAVGLAKLLGLRRMSAAPDPTSVAA